MPPSGGPGSDPPGGGSASRSAGLFPPTCNLDRIRPEGSAPPGGPPSSAPFIGRETIVISDGPSPAPLPFASADLPRPAIRTIISSSLRCRSSSPLKLAAAVSPPGDEDDIERRRCSSARFPSPSSAALEKSSTPSSSSSDPSALAATESRLARVRVLAVSSLRPCGRPERWWSKA